MAIYEYRDAKRLKQSYNPDAQYSRYSPELENRYKELFAQYGNTEYWDRFMSNPWLNIANYDGNVTRRDSTFWDDTTRKYQEEALRYVSELVSSIGETNYNSASAQVARERMAGINSDLSGNITPGEATESDLTSIDPVGSDRSDFMNQRFQRGMQVYDAGVGFLESFMSLAGEMQGLRSGSISNTASELKMLSGSQDYLFDYLSSNMPVPKKDDSGEYDFSDYLSNLKDTLNDPKFYKQFPYSRRTRRTLQRVGGMISSDPVALASKAEGLFKSFVEGRTDRIKGMSDIAWSDDALEMLSNWSKSYSELSYDVWKIQQEFQKEIAEYNRSYYARSNELGQPRNKAGLDNTGILNQNSYQSELNNLDVPRESAHLEDEQIAYNRLKVEADTTRQKAINKAEDEFNKIQQRYLSGDKWYHVLGRLLLPVFRSLVTQGINSYFQSAMSSLGRVTFGPSPSN